MSQRAFYSIDETVLDKFNRLVSTGKRSKVVEDLIASHVAIKDDAISQAAKRIEADASYRDVMNDTGSLAFETLIRMDADEQGRYLLGGYSRPQPVL
jgi:NADPH:quinone reductase-like Zn-dependent oxidoreductase